MKSIKLIADHYYQSNDLVRTKDGERCKLVNVGDTIFTSGSYIPTDYDSVSMNSTSNYVIADCEITL